MCFTKEISFSFAFLGLILSYIILQNQDKFTDYAYIPAIYFTVMEITQGLQYFDVNQCNEKINEDLTNFAYFLLLLQPLIWNLIFYFRGKKYENETDNKILFYSIILCVIWIILHFLRRFKFFGEYIDDDEELKGNKTCTYRQGNNHLYWKFKLYNNKIINVGWYIYIMLYFIPGFLTSNEENRKDILMLASGWIISKIYVYLTKHNPHAFASIWCLTSIPHLFLRYLPSVYKLYS